MRRGSREKEAGDRDRQERGGERERESERQLRGGAYGEAHAAGAELTVTAFLVFFCVGPSRSHALSTGRSLFFKGSVVKGMVLFRTTRSR